MAAEVKPILPFKPPPGPAPLTPDQLFYSSFRNPLSVPSPQNAAITSITHTALSENFAVTSGSRVQLFSGKTRKLVKTISRFGVDDVARSGVVRRDGRLLAAGGDSGVVQVFDTSSRAILRQWRPQKQQRQAVHAVRWNPADLTSLMSAGDDGALKMWDLTADEPAAVMTGHQDYVRTAEFMHGQSGMIVSGGYDQTVRLWDTRQPGRSAMTFLLGAPVESVLSLSASSLAAANGPEVAILNLVAGKAETILRAHNKTVTSLATSQQSTRLLTASLDGHVKAHNTAAWTVEYGFKFSAPVLSAAIIPSSSGEDRHLAVGLQSGLLSVRTRLQGAEKAKARERAKYDQALIAGEADEYERKQKKKQLRQGDRIRDRGKDFRGEGADIVISGNDRSRTKKLEKWQRSLRKGAYATALDEVLAMNDTQDILTCITALRHRSALRTALSNRTDEELLPVVAWTLKRLGYPRDLALVQDVLLLLLDLYAQRLPDWVDSEDLAGRELASLVNRVGKRVRRGAEMAQQAVACEGMLALLS